MMIETTTTDFKRALNVVTNSMSASEMKLYDVGIQLRYSGTTGTLIMKHPLTELISMADFEGNASEESFETVFFLGTLLNDLKPLRKKEDITIELGSEIILSTDEDEIFRDETVEDRIHIPAQTKLYEMNRKDFIDVLHVSGSLTKTTFMESTMSAQIVGYKDKLHVNVTNLAQFAQSNLQLDKEISETFDITLDAKEITKVRNVISKGKGKIVKFFVNGQNMGFITDTTTVIFKSMVNVSHIDVNKIFQYLSWEDNFYAFDSKVNAEIAKVQYDLLREAEKEKDKELEKTYQVVPFNRDLDIKKIILDTEGTFGKVPTRDMYNIIKKLPNEMEVAVNDKCILFNNKTDTKQIMLLVPYTQ